METVPVWAWSILVFLFVGAIGIVGYFLKKRDSDIDTITNLNNINTKEIEDKIEQVLDEVKGVSSRLIKLETEINNFSGRMKSQEFKTVEVERAVQDIKVQMATVMEWKRNNESLS